MKVVLDLKHSINNYYWDNKEELREYINGILDELNILYVILRDTDKIHIDDTTLNRLYDILDMFTQYDLKLK